MIKKINKRFRHSERLANQKEKGVFESLREMLGLVSASAGILVVLLYLAGRSYAGGYFEAMNIPIYQLTFTLWEYGEVGGIPLILLMLCIIGATIALYLLTWVIFILVENIIKGWQMRVKLSKAASNRVRILGRLLDLSTMVSIALILIFAMSTIAHALGDLVGQNNILKKSPQIEIISKVPLALDDNLLTPTKASGQDYYVYVGFHELTFNNGKYYLFKEIDPLTCKPLKVYVIEPGQDVQVNLLAPETLSDKCQAAMQQTVTPTISIPKATLTP